MHKQLRNLALLILFVTLPVEGAPPAWWHDPTTQILEDPQPPASENYAPVNVGQLKHVAIQAQAHLDQNLPGGAGFQIRHRWQPLGAPPPSAAENYAPANVGQLKAIAKPFYDRLNSVGYNTKQNLIMRGYPSNWSFDYPWSTDDNVNSAENYAPVNIGQLKMVFGFDLTDSDGDGLLDWWEIYYFGDLQRDGTGDFDGDGLSDLFEFQGGGDPTTDPTADPLKHSNFQYDSMGRVIKADDITFVFDIEGNLESSN